MVTLDNELSARSASHTPTLGIQSIGVLSAFPPFDSTEGADGFQQAMGMKKRYLPHYHLTIKSDQGPLSLNSRVYSRRSVDSLADLFAPRSDLLRAM